MTECCFCGFESKSRAVFIEMENGGHRCKSGAACLRRMRSGEYLKRPVRLKLEIYHRDPRDIRVVDGSNSLPVWPTVPTGWYAVLLTADELAFYKVEERGLMMSVFRLFGPNEEQLDQVQSSTVLDRIADVGAEEASKTYGREIGHCGVCGTRLTNDESRARGIGPICAQKYGW